METIELIPKSLEESLKKRYPLGIPRAQIGEATGGVLHSRTEANRDCTECGIKGRFKIGRQTLYPVAEVVKYLREKTTFVRAKK